jgi:cytochrome c peroxidase
VVGDRAYVAEHFSDTLAVLDLKSAATDSVAQIALGPRPQLTPQRRGEMLFYDATICFQHWQSCATCHPDARVDGLNWDLLNDGLGNPKNTRNLLHVFHGGPTMALGVRENADSAVRAGITHILFAVRPEEDVQALDAYLKSLEPVPSPALVDGKLTPAAEHGKQLFFSTALNCAECHPAPYYSDKRSHFVGSQGKHDKLTDSFNTPRLTEAWRTAPYMHDGHYLTINELLSQGRHGLHGERKPKLSTQDIDDLAEFVKSL